MMEYRKAYSIKLLSKVLDVSEQGYYKWLNSRNKPYKYELLLVKIKEIRSRHKENENYGIERLKLALLQAGYEISLSTIYRVCKANNLLIKKKWNPKGVTKSDRKAEKSENLLKQDFKAKEPNQKWLSDITEIPCIDGKLYLSAVLDCFDGQIVGLAMDDNMKAELAVKSFENACKRHSAKGMIFHSDRGSQYTSYLFRASLANFGAKQSMSGTGRCYDNARMESFFATLKKEKLYKINTIRLTKSTIKSIIFRYIETYYNQKRIYTPNPMGLPPTLYRKYFYNMNRLVA